MIHLFLGFPSVGKKTTLYARQALPDALHGTFYCLTVLVSILHSSPNHLYSKCPVWVARSSGINALVYLQSNTCLHPLAIPALCMFHLGLQQQLTSNRKSTSALHVSSWLATTINFESKIHMLNKITKNSLKKHKCCFYITRRTFNVLPKCFIIFQLSTGPTGHNFRDFYNISHVKHQQNKNPNPSSSDQNVVLTKVLICVFNLLLDDKHQMLIENTERHFGAQISEVILRPVFPYLKLYC
ncbi:hypothetical protein Pint_35800 [Pistacia integerrima]|uniref:Uncharacterized protein n=1 Tax=Pistacia integerrima TaxID=434235 RepID=A0ACC0Y5E6_9ROSI|nr:hypothetical protein Pint_35800 [Pistacia integerrima]